MSKSATMLNAAPLLRRLAALIYDSLIVIGLLIVGSILAVMINQGQAITSQNHWFPPYLLGIIFSYFCLSWVYGKQTIGMRAWRLTIHSFNGEPMDVWRACMRFGYATPSLLLAGVGLWWVIIDRQGLAWHDRWSGSYLCYTP